MAPKLKSSSVTLIPVKLPRVEPGQNLESTILQAFKKQKVSLRNGDVVSVASKVVSICKRRIMSLDDVEVSERARRIAKRWAIDGRLAEVVLHEAEAILGGVKGFLLTVKNGNLTANAGVDLKNSPPGTVILWPEDADRSARELQKSLEVAFRLQLCVEIVDSRVTPLRLGTTGLAIGLSGFLPVRDERGKLDLYGRRVRATQTNIADDLAAAAHLLMGEVDERVGVVVIRNAPLILGEEYASRRVKLGAERCLITSNISTTLQALKRRSQFI